MALAALRCTAVCGNACGEHVDPQRTAMAEVYAVSCGLRNYDGPDSAVGHGMAGGLRAERSDLLVAGEQECDRDAVVDGVEHCGRGRHETGLHVRGASAA